MKCNYCDVEITGEHFHHPACPNDEDNKNNIIWHGERLEDAPKDADGIFRVDGEYVATKTID